MIDAYATFSTGQIRSLNTEGARFYNKAIAIVDESRDALEKMPESKNGLVVGSGQNTQAWHLRGWETLDIDPQAEATYTADANKFLPTVPGGFYDYVFSENLTLHRNPGNPAIQLDSNGRPYDQQPAVGYKQIISQAARVLKPNGKFIMTIADFGESPVSLPNAETLATLLKHEGFEAVLEIRNLSDFLDSTERNLGVQTIWYAQKRD